MIVSGSNTNEWCAQQCASRVCNHDRYISSHLLLYMLILCQAVCIQGICRVGLLTLCLPFIIDIPFVIILLMSLCISSLLVWI